LLSYHFQLLSILIMKPSIFALLSGASTALAATRGFNYASQGQTEADFASSFQTAASLSGASDFTSARLYTMIQDGTTDTPITAIQAAIDTKTTLLLGLWASVDQDAFNNEITALKSAISQYGSDFADLVVGISVGSEDLYRISPTGIAADSGVGQSPDVLVDYIGQVRSAISGTSLSTKPVGHVDTWNVYVNGSNSEVISNSDFLGLDEYPYYQTTDSNSIGESGYLFFQAYDRVAAVAGGKPIWITESGWPVSGPTSNLAVASVANAEDYWQEVACALENRDINMWWYILQDSGASPSFGVSSNGQPLYDLACNSTAGYTSSTSSSSSATSSASNKSTATGSHTASGASTTDSAGGSGSSGGSTSGSTTANGGSTNDATTTGASGAGATGATGTSSATFALSTGAASRVKGSMAGLAGLALAAAVLF
jgi:glucan endo-1,3-beta-D-glucosidase